MSPLEHAIRAACEAMGANPDTWQGFETIGRVALNALIEALPPDLAEALRRHLQGD